jgi:hypothetical protein
MARFLIEYCLPLLLPSLLYLAWIAWRRRAAAAGRAASAPEWTEGPWFWLALAGIGLSLAAFLATAILWGHVPTADYRPPQLIKGVVVPGHFGDQP